MPDAIEKLFCEMYRRLEAGNRSKPLPASAGRTGDRRDPYRQLWKLILEDLHQPADRSVAPPNGAGQAFNLPTG